jgi:hypothetical protein
MNRAAVVLISGVIGVSFLYLAAREEGSPSVVVSGQVKESPGREDHAKRMEGGSQVESSGETPPQLEEVSPVQSPSKAEWLANFNAAQVERHLTLSPSEREEVLSAFLSGKNLNNLGEILGEERARLFTQKREQALAEAEEEETQDFVFKLSRKLGLSPEEEREVEQAVRSARTALKPRYSVIRSQSDEAMALHDSSPDDGTRLRELYDLLKREVAKTREAEKALLIEQLQGVLPDEKLNALIEALSK